MDVVELPHQPRRDVLGDARVVGYHRCLLEENVMKVRSSPHHDRNRYINNRYLSGLHVYATT
jgi:hypothetical protein